MRNDIAGISVEAYCIRPLNASSKETYDQNPDTYGAYAIRPYPDGQKGLFLRSIFWLCEMA